MNDQPSGGGGPIERDNKFQALTPGITLAFSDANLLLSYARQPRQTSGPYERSPRSRDRLLPARSHEILESECSFGGWYLGTSSSTWLGFPLVIDRRLGRI